jgi:hypothetical protein
MSKVIHHSFVDPADVKGDEETRLAAFRHIRNQIQAYFDETFVEVIRK